jgi:hypothetical protein
VAERLGCIWLSGGAVGSCVAVFSYDWMLAAAVLSVAVFFMVVMCAFPLHAAVWLSCVHLCECAIRHYHRYVIYLSTREIFEKVDNVSQIRAKYIYTV